MAWGGCFGKMVQLLAAPLLALEGSYSCFKRDTGQDGPAILLRRFLLGGVGKAGPAFAAPLLAQGQTAYCAIGCDRNGKQVEHHCSTLWCRFACVCVWRRCSVQGVHAEVVEMDFMRNPNLHSL